MGKWFLVTSEIKSRRPWHPQSARLWPLPAPRRSSSVCLAHLANTMLFLLSWKCPDPTMPAPTLTQPERLAQLSLRRFFNAKPTPAGRRQPVPPWLTCVTVTGTGLGETCKWGHVLVTRIYDIPVAQEVCLRGFSDDPKAD